MNTRFLVSTIFILIVAVAGAVWYFNKPARQQPASININQPNPMKITSPAFENNAGLPAKYTCDGENINPPLAVSGVPAEAKSLTLILDDPDAPVAGGFVHWVVFNLDPTTKNIEENSLPASGIGGMNSTGKTGYVSPCPPSGTHRYFFKLYALDSSLGLDSSAKREDVEKAMQGHILAQAELIGLYKKP